MTGNAHSSFHPTSIFLSPEATPFVCIRVNSWLEKATHYNNGGRKACSSVRPNFVCTALGSPSSGDGKRLSRPQRYLTTNEHQFTRMTGNAHSPFHHFCLLYSSEATPFVSIRG